MPTVKVYSFGSYTERQKGDATLGQYVDETDNPDEIDTLIRKAPEHTYVSLFITVMGELEQLANVEEAKKYLRKNKPKLPYRGIFRQSS